MFDAPKEQNDPTLQALSALKDRMQADDRVRLGISIFMKTRQMLSPDPQRPLQEQISKVEYEILTTTIAIAMVELFDVFDNERKEKESEPKQDSSAASS